MRQNIGRLTDAQLFINHGIQRIREEVITTENGSTRSTSTVSTGLSR